MSAVTSGHANHEAAHSASEVMDILPIHLWWLLVAPPLPSLLTTVASAPYLQPVPYV